MGFRPEDKSETVRWEREKREASQRTIRVVLTTAQTLEADAQAWESWEANDAAGARVRFGQPEAEKFTHSRVGMRGERAMCLAFGLPWTPYPGMARRHEPDRHGIDVRTFTHPRGTLLLHPDDPDGRIVVAIFADHPTYELLGWYWSHLGKRSEWWRTDIRHPAYLVPRAELRDLASIPGMMGWESAA